MGLYKRVCCPQCDKYQEFRNGEDKLRKATCPKCGYEFKITEQNAVYYLDYCHNKKRYREKVGPYKTIAEAALYKRRTQITENKFFDVSPDGKVKFEDFSKYYFDHHSKRFKKSWITDSYHIKDFNSFFKNKYLSEITAKEIERFQAVRLQKVSKSTVNRQLGVLRSMLNKAVAWGKLQNNPMKTVQFFPEPEGRLRFLEKEEIRRLIGNCDSRLRPIVVLAIYTGMRRGEILNLQWLDVDFKRNIITLLDTKNGKSRQVPMNSLVVAALNQIERHPKSRYVFCYENGERIQDVRKPFSTALNNSGIKDFHLHDLRHTFASQLVMAGVDLNTVRELLGHKDIKMTLRYAHLAPSHKQLAVEALVASIDTTLTQEQPPEVQVNFEASEPLENTLVAIYGK